MTRKKKWWIAIVAILLVAAVVGVLLQQKKANGEKDEKGPDIPTLAAKIADVQVVVREVGTVEPEVKVDIKSNLSGRVVDLPVRAGDEVAKGKLIARIEPDVNQAQNLLTVKNLFTSSDIEFQDAKENFEAKQQLFEDGLVSVEVHRQAETRFRQAQQSLDAAREGISVVESSGIPMGDNPRQVVNIVAPMPGVIIDRPVELGETVTGSGSFNAGTVIATVADLASMMVKAGVNEVDIGKIHVGQEVRVTLDAFPRKLFPGSIKRIAPAARLDNQVKVFEVEIGLEHLGLELRTGMTANIEIRGDIHTDVLSIPVESVFVRGDEEFAYVKREKPLPPNPKKADKADEEDGEQEDNGKVDGDEEDLERKAEAESQPDSVDEELIRENEILPEDWRDDPRQEWRRFFEERRVLTGIASTTDVEIVEGLEEGEEIALADPSRPQEDES